MTRGSPDQFVRSDAEAPDQGRPWLGIKFACAGAYLRVYRNKEGTAYNATCPKCGHCVRFRVGQGGSNERFFEVRC